MRMQFCLLLLFLVAHPLQAKELTVACWNVENLFDEHVNKQTPDEDVFTPENVNLKLKHDAAILQELKADIIGLVEVENKPIVRRLVEEHLQDQGYKYVELIENRSTRGIDCAIISRYPFLARNFAIPGFEREILGARFVFNGQPLYVLVNHWKSRGGGGEDKRMAAAEAVLDVINHQIPAYEGKAVPVIVMGDLNDEAFDDSVKHLTEQGLIDTFKDVPQEKRWTIPYYDYDQRKALYQGFDHILITPGLLMGKVRWTQSEVIRPRVMIRTRRIQGENYIWLDDDYNDHIGYSDHFPVKAWFVIED